MQSQINNTISDIANGKFLGDSGVNVEPVIVEGNMLTPKALYALVDAMGENGSSDTQILDFVLALYKNIEEKKVTDSNLELILTELFLANNQ